MKDNFKELLNEFSEKWYEISYKTNLACWEFYINSTDENMRKYQKLQDNLSDLFKDKNYYEKFKNLNISDLNKHEQKQLKNVIKNFEEELNSSEELKKLREKENEIAKKFNSYIPKINGKEVSKTELNKIMQTEPSVLKRKKAYQARIKAGDLIAEDLKDFVKQRNEYAVSKGYSNYYEYKLKEDYEVDLKELLELLDDIYKKSQKEILKINKETQKKISKFYQIKPEELKNYHYGYILESDPESKINKSFKTKEEIVQISRKTYNNMGYDTEKLENERKLVLDLFPRKNKNTHGFCFDLDAGRDARILANLTNNITSLDTLNHELGHCMYDLFISRDLPFIDRTTYPAMTEAIAMMMGDLVKTENILSENISKTILEKFKNTFKKSEVEFVSRSLIIINFEYEMYKNPEQNLKKLWRDLGVKYRNRNSKEELNNEWATIPHYLSHPAYYQNYFRATIIKAQIYNYLKSKLGNITENKNTAKFLNENLFNLGTSLEEKELIVKLTGKKLSVDDFVSVLEK